MQGGAEAAPMSVSGGRRILILAPHPDDETVGCAIAAQRARSAGAAVFVLTLTTGVPPKAALYPWRRGAYAARVARRRAEAAAATGLLRIVPIGCTEFPSRTLKSEAAAALRLIAAAVAAHGVDEIWTPAWEGGHQDHDVTNFLAASFADRLQVTEFAEYNFAGGAVHSQSFPHRTGAEELIVLTPAEAALKARALALYRSERGNLAHVRTTQEMLRPLPRHDYAKAPHDGTLFCERFHWVPFRHPRIDFERAHDVRRTLGRLSRAEERR
jgi:LmbE family N-acetylglucosaminyl deacetylase